MWIELKVVDPNTISEKIMPINFDNIVTFAPLLEDIGRANCVLYTSSPFLSTVVVCETFDDVSHKLSKAKNEHN